MKDYLLKTIHFTLIFVSFGAKMKKERPLFAATKTSCPDGGIWRIAGSIRFEHKIWFLVLEKKLQSVNGV